MRMGTVANMTVAAWMVSEMPELAALLGLDLDAGTALRML